METRRTYNRPFNYNYNATMDSFTMLHRFESTMDQVKNMVESQAIYSTWIRVQFGKNEPITFNTASQEMKENCIANLEIQKTGAGVTNSFSLKIIWDPFDNGQNPTEKLQGLDDIIADALDASMLTENDKLRGYIQYGYNIVDDNSLVSPIYEFYLTKADSEIEWTTGLVTYNFEGCTILGLDCDLTNISYNGVGGDGKPLMEVVRWVLYYYYGDKDNPPYGIDPGTETYKNSPCYKIDIPEGYFTQCQSNFKIETTAGQITPWQYCLNIMNYDQNSRMTTSDQSIEAYNDWDKLNDSQKPYWSLYVTDSDRTIHVVHYSPLNNATQDIKGDDGMSLYMEKAITWGLQKTSLVTKWHSSVDLYYYLVSKIALGRKTGLQTAQLNYDIALANYNEAQNTYEQAVAIANEEQSQVKHELTDKLKQEYEQETDPRIQKFQRGKLYGIGGTEDKPTGGMAGMDQAVTEYRVETSTKQEKQELDKQTENLRKATLELQETKNNYSKQLNDIERFNAEISLVGIPADVPIGAVIPIIPRILESVPNRQAGYYLVTESEDRISTNGIFETTIKLFRTKGLTQEQINSYTSKYQ